MHSSDVDKVRSCHWRCSIKKFILKNSAIFTGKHFFNKDEGLQTPTQVLFSEYCKIFKSTYLEEHLRTAASEMDG